MVRDIVFMHPTRDKFGEMPLKFNKLIKNSVRKFARLSSVLVISSLLVGQTVFAAPFSYEYSDTLTAGTSIAGVNVGDSAKVTVTLDNGGATRNSQTWTSAHLQAVTWNFNSGAVVTTFSAPFGGGLDGTVGNFVSDASGNLTSVMNNWKDNGNVGTDFTTNSAGIPNTWYLNGGNSVYDENGALLQAKLTVVGNMLTATNWAISTSTATPTGLTATVASATQIDLSWTDNSSDETGFKIFRNGTELTPSPKVGAGIATFSDTGLTCNTAYTYTVKATNANGDSSVAATTPTTTTTAACQAVSAPIFSLKDKPAIFSEEVK